MRIIRACKEMGIYTVAVYSEADRESLHVALADQAICIGGPRAEESYLDGGRIVGCGTHGTLLRSCETYREIALSQLSAAELGEEG